MLGDNRAISCDSRYWGPIKGSSIIGKVVLVLWHDDRPDFRRFLILAAVTAAPSSYGHLIIYPSFHGNRALFLLPAKVSHS